MKTIEELKQEDFWCYFFEICRIPRPSKKEQKIAGYINDFARENHLEYKNDKAGNIIVSKPASKGLEHLKKVVLQSHLDMVGEKKLDVKHDFDTDPIDVYAENGWIKARGTTLGADNGIGIAMQLALLADENIQHGPIECLFTVDEETGLTGAFALDNNFITGSILINLDSEDDGEVFIGCAGGIDTIANLKYSLKKISTRVVSSSLIVKGLKGGHSGDDIHKGRGNAIRIASRFLWNVQRDLDIRLHVLEGGNLRNAIPREATALFSVKEKYLEELLEFFSGFRRDIKNELHIAEPELEIELEKRDRLDYCLDRKTQRRLLLCLYTCPNGVVTMSQEIEDLVETSTNLASVEMQKDTFKIVTSQRSNLESAKADIAARVRGVFELAGAKVKHSDGYPGWNPNTNSEILRIAEYSYQKLYKTKPKVRAIHAGLECGLFLEKYPGLDMISIGPQISDAHSPDERLDIGSTERTWKFLLDILKNIPADK